MKVGKIIFVSCKGGHGIHVEFSRDVLIMQQSKQAVLKDNAGAKHKRELQKKKTRW